MRYHHRRSGMSHFRLLLLRLGGVMSAARTCFRIYPVCVKSDALRQIKLLLRVNPKFEVLTQIDLVVLVLPVWLSDKIDRKVGKKLSPLMS